MKIHGIVYLIVGITVIIVSSLIENFLLFIIVGVILTAVGLIKIITGVTKKEKYEPEIQHEKKISYPNSRDPNQYVTCKYCKAYNYPNAKFCHYCGRRIK